MNTDVCGPLQVVVFSLGDFFCALPIGFVREVLLLPELARPPGLPAAAAGFVQVGPETLPVLRLGSLLQIPIPPESLYSHVLLLKNAPAALLVDKVHEIVSIPAGGVLAIPDPESLNGCIEGAFSWSGNRVHLLAAAKVLSEKERQAALDLQTWELQRSLAMAKAGAR